MTVPVYFSSLAIVLGTVLLIVAMITYALVQRGRARQAHGEAYQRLAERAAEAETATAATLAAMRDDLADVRTRMTAVETLLRDVG